MGVEKAGRLAKELIELQRKALIRLMNKLFIYRGGG